MVCSTAKNILLVRRQCENCYFKEKNPIFTSDQDVIIHCYFAVHYNSSE